MAAKRPMAAHSGSGAAVLLSAGPEPSAHAFPAHCGDVVEVATHDQAGPRPGQADVKVLAAAALVAYAVHGKDRDRPLKSFEARDVAVEHVVTSEERIPVAVPAVVAEHLPLQLVPRAGHEQRDLSRLPAFAEEPVDLGISLVDRLVR